MRIASIDLFRVIAIFGVVLIHTDPFVHAVFGNGATHFVEIVVTRAARVGVPFFFIVSGYFFACRTRAGCDPLRLFARYAYRLMSLFVIWSAFYLIVPSKPLRLLSEGYGGALATKLHWCARHPVLLLLQGIKPHLWFLPSLTMALAIVAGCLRCNARRLLPCLAIGLYLLALLAGPYAGTAFGMQVGFDPRNGPFFGTIFVYLGVLLAARPRLVGSGGAVIMVVVGGLGFGLELSAIKWVFHAAPTIEDFGLFTVPYAVGFAALALNHPSWGSNTRWPDVGRTVLGIYLVHALFVDWLWPLHRILHSYVWEVAFPLTVLTLSVLATAGLSRVPVTRPYVT